MANDGESMAADAGDEYGFKSGLCALPNGLSLASPNGLPGCSGFGGSDLPLPPPAPGGANGPLVKLAGGPLACGAATSCGPICANGGGASHAVPGTVISAWHLGQRAFLPAASSGTRRSWLHWLQRNSIAMSFLQWC